MKYLLPLILVLSVAVLAEGCAIGKLLSNPAKAIKELFTGKPKPPPVLTALDDPVNMTPEELARMRAWCGEHSQPTVIEKFRSLLILGVTAGTAIFGVGVLMLIFAKGMDKKIPPTCIGVGLVLITLSILFDEYLQGILVIAIIILAVAGVILLRKHWKKLKKWVAWGDEAISAGHLSPDDIDAVAEKTLGPKGSKDRETQKALVTKARA